MPSPLLNLACPLMKIVIESPEKLTDSDLEEIDDMWNRKGRRIVV